MQTALPQKLQEPGKDLADYRLATGSPRGSTVMENENIAGLQIPREPGEDSLGMGTHRVEPSSCPGHQGQIPCLQ